MSDEYYVPADDGRWVNEKYMRLAEIIQDYDPQFELRWVPPEMRSDAERGKPYVIWDTIVNCPVFFCSELESPEQILAKLFMGDNAKHDVLAALDAQNAAVQAFQMKKKMEENEQRMEMVEWLMKTKKNYITLPGGRKVDDQLRPIR